MHEMTIASNLIQIVTGELERQNIDKPVTEIEFIGGRMNAIIPESLVFNFDVLKKDVDQLSETKLVYSEEPIRIRCNQCHSKREIDEPLFVCDKCGSSDIEVISGKEMYVKSFDISD